VVTLPIILALAAVGHMFGASILLDRQYASTQAFETRKYRRALQLLHRMNRSISWTAKDTFADIRQVRLPDWMLINQLDWSLLGVWEIA